MPVALSLGLQLSSTKPGRASQPQSASAQKGPRTEQLAETLVEKSPYWPFATVWYHCNYRAKSRILPEIIFSLIRKNVQLT